jgi:Protein of unknown function (DUF2911)
MRTARALSFVAAMAVAGLPGVAAGTGPGSAGLELPRECPTGKISQQVGLTEIAVEYGSPAVAGRKIWGGLVPFDRVWSLGGYQAPKIRFSRDVTFGDKPVPAGTYALYAVPSRTSWTLILNKGAEQRDYRSELDVARIAVHPKVAPARERLAFAIGDFNDDSASLELAWERLRLTIPIRVNTTEEVLSSINSLDNTWRAYANAARYMLENKKDYDAGMKYVDQSLAMKEDWFNVWIKAQLQAAKGDYKDARATGEHAYDLGKKSPMFFLEGEIKKTLDDWKKKKG